MNQKIKILAFIFLILILSATVIGCESLPTDQTLDALIIEDVLFNEETLEQTCPHEEGEDIVKNSPINIPYGFEEALVTKVIDGDTIEIASGERVRFIGVDAPEMGFQSGEYEEGATAATEFVRELIEGRIVWLESDGNNEDRFGRLRRYVWLEIPVDKNNPDEIRAYMLNAILLEQGLAEVAIFGTPRHEGLFRELCQF